jgi:outer membrane protein assembly factor BamB
MRKTSAFLMALGLLPSLVFTLPAHAGADTYRYDTGHTGYTADTVAPPLALLWRHTTEPAVGSTASPVTAGNIVYFAAGAHVYAVRTTDGATVWQYPATSDATLVFNGTPAVSDGAVFVGSTGGTLYKLDAKTGNLLASQDAGGAVRGAPTVENGVVYFGSSNSHCYAASADTLGILWDFTAEGAVPTSPCIAGDDVIFASADGSVTCLAKQSGRKQWALEFNGDPTSSPPVYADGTLYVAAAETLYAIDAHDGATQWKQTLSGAATTTPTVWPSGIGIGTLDGTLSVYTRDGRLRWRDGLGTPPLAPALRFRPIQDA